MNLATVYVNASVIQKQSAKNTIEEFSDELSMIRGKCLDIGSGPGDVTKNLLLPRLQSDVVVVGNKKTNIYHTRYLVGNHLFVAFFFIFVSYRF